MTPTLILDCSIVMAWCFDDESTPETNQIQDRMANEAAVVSGLWYLEISNVLALAEKRKRITSEGSQQFLQLLTVFDIQVDDDAPRRAFGHLLPLCRTHGLTSYEAVYLDLLIRRQIPLASLNDPLRKAATTLGLPVLGK